MMDTTLVIEALNGNSDAFGSLVEKYERPLFNLAYRISGDYEDAMDITQTVFVKAFERLDSFDPSRNFFSSSMYSLRASGPRALSFWKLSNPISLISQPHRCPCWPA